MSQPTPKQYQELQEKAKDFYDSHQGGWGDTMNDLVIDVIETWEKMKGEDSPHQLIRTNHALQEEIEGLKRSSAILQSRTAQLTIFLSDLKTQLTELNLPF